MASGGQIQFDETDEDELYVRGDRNNSQTTKVNSMKKRANVVLANNSQTAANDSSSNEGESNTSPRTNLAVDESSNSTFRYDSEHTSKTSSKNKSRKKKKGHKTTDETQRDEDGSHMVDTLSDTTETQHTVTFDSTGKEELAAATDTNKFTAISRRESFKNIGKIMSGKMHASNLESQNEDEEIRQDPENKKHSNPMNWIKGRFRKQNKEQTNASHIEMEDIHLESPNEERTDGNNLLAGYPATLSQQPAPRPASYNNSYIVTQTMSAGAAVDIDETDAVQMNEKQRSVYSQKMCMSVTLAIVLVAGVIVGIILWAMSSVGLAFQILGPTLFGLSLFALVYKLFLTFIWKEDPYPSLQKYFNKGKNPI